MHCLLNSTGLCFYSLCLSSCRHQRFTKDCGHRKSAKEDGASVAAHLQWWPETQRRPKIQICPCLRFWCRQSWEGYYRIKPNHDWPIVNEHVLEKDSSLLLSTEKSLPVLKISARVEAASGALYKILVLQWQVFVESFKLLILAYIWTNFAWKECNLKVKTGK